jgi:Tol biopolymer transport system component
MTQVFISYARKDFSFVVRLANDLKNAGFEVWYDVSGISGGSRWMDKIEEAIRNSDFLVVVLSPESVVSEWVDREFLFANKLRRKIIPLYYRDCDLSINYINLNYIDVQGNNYHKNFAQILVALSGRSLLASKSEIVKPTPPNSKLKTNLVVFSVVIAVLGLAIGSFWLRPWSPFSPAQPPTEPITVAPVVSPSSAPASSTAPLSATATSALSADFWITYTTNANGNRDIFMLNPSTGEKQGVITERYHDKVGTWSPDGKWLAFESSRVSPNFYQIYLFDREQGKTIALTNAENCSNWSPAWSPDGAQIAFYSNCENNQRDIYVMNRDGSGRKRLTTSGGEDKFPVFSPDGNQIAFTSTRSGRDQIFLMDVDGNNQRIVADGCSSNFSPDGEWLWFSAACEDSDIKRIRIDGTDLKTIGSRFGQNPSLSPDGQFVAFQSGDDIWMMRVDGSNPVRLTSGGEEEGAPLWKP